MSALVVCDGCSRHVKSDEAACPFCGRGVSAQSAVCDADPGVARGLSRGKAALVAVVTVTASLSMAACYGGPPRHNVNYQPQPTSTTEPAPPRPNGQPNSNQIAQDPNAPQRTQ